jgi:hypothetical protein
VEAQARGPFQPTAAGWRRVWRAAAVVMVLATLFAAWNVAEEPTGSACREDEGWAYLWILFTPIVAAASVLTMVVMAKRAIGLAGWPAALTTGLLLTIAVFASWVLVFVVVVLLEAACIVANPPYGAATLILPAVIGIATVLVPMRLWPAIVGDPASESRSTNRAAQVLVFAATLKVPPEGMLSWQRPDPNGPSTQLVGGLLLFVIQRIDDWAQVRASNDWVGWVDARRLIPFGAHPPSARDTEQ